MTKQELRIDSFRLFAGKTIEDSYELIDIYLEYFFLVIRNHQKDKINTTAERDAKIVNQMMFTKIAHLKQVVQGIRFISKDGTKLNKIIDPTFVGVLVRNIFETVGMFHLININTKSDDEKIILYNLWVIAGLKYRQRFGEGISSAKNTKELKDEEQSIKRYISQIENTVLYKSMSEKNQKKIQDKIKQKDFKIRFDDFRNVEFLDWQQLASIMDIKDKIMSNIYSYFSLYAHPSNVAVFQFANLFEKDDAYFIEMTNFNLRNAFFLISVFIADYIKLFPNVINSYNSLSLRDQIVINWVNIFARSDEHSINDAILELN